MLSEEERKHVAKVMKGLTISDWIIKDAETEEVLYDDRSFFRDYLFKRKDPMDQKARKIVIPRQTLECRAIAINVTVYSEESVQDLNSVSRLYLDGKFVEKWSFSMGFVIPGSTNTWEAFIVKSDAGYLDPETLSGHLLVDSVVRDGDLPLLRSNLKIYISKD